MMSRELRDSRRRARCVVMVAALALISAVPVRAQFVCAGSTDGDAPQTGQGATAIGSTANVACGRGASANGNGASNVALGTFALAEGGNNSSNVAVGTFTDAHGNQSHNTASGSFADAHGEISDNTANGFLAKAVGDGSGNTAIGTRANASGNGSSNVAIGDSATASGDSSKNTAIGANSLAANNSAAFGAGAQATFVNSAAFGNGAKATRANQQAFGTTTNTYSMPGLTSAASKAAQSGPTQVVTTDALGNLGTTAPSSLGLATGADVALSVDQLSRRINKSNTGVAMAFAIAGVPTLLSTEKFAFATNWGTFQGENGAALSGAVRIYRNVQLQGSFAYGFRENMAGGHAGLRFGF